MEKLDVCPCCVVAGTWRPWYTLFAIHLGAIMLAETRKLKKWLTRCGCTSYRIVLLCSRPAPIPILLACLLPAKSISRKRDHVCVMIPDWFSARKMPILCCIIVWICVELYTQAKQRVIHAGQAQASSYTVTTSTGN